MGKKQKIKLKYDNINNSPKSKITFGVCACACVCVFGGWGGESEDRVKSEKFNVRRTNLGRH